MRIVLARAVERDPLQLFKSLLPTTGWKPLEGGWFAEPPTPGVVTRAKTQGRPVPPDKNWQIHEFGNEDHARTAHVINQLMRNAKLQAPEGKLVLHNSKIALARHAVPAGHKQIQGLPTDEHNEQAVGIHALLNTDPHHFDHFTPDGDPHSPDVHSRSHGIGLHLAHGTNWGDPEKVRDLVTRLAADAGTEGKSLNVTKGIKNVVKLRDEHIENAVAGAGFHPKTADAIVQHLKDRREVLRNLLASGELAGDPNANANLKFAQKYDPKAGENEDILVGAPPEVTQFGQDRGKALAAREGIKQRLKKLAAQGEFGKGWYRNSAEAIKKRFGGDIEKMRRYAALLAVYSPQSTPHPNTEAAERAMQHFLNGEPEGKLRGGGTSVQDANARALLYHNHWHSGLKTNAFYRNLMHYIEEGGDKDRPPGLGEKQPVTVDRWAARSVGHDLGQTKGGDLETERSLSPQQYRFSARILNEVAHELQIPTHELQERMWVAEKGMSLARQAAINEHVKQPGSYAKKHNMTAKQFLEHIGGVAAPMAPGGLKRQLKNLEIDPTSKSTANQSFASGLHQMGGHIIADLNPDEQSGMLEGLGNLPHEAKAELHHRLLNALHENNRLIPADLADIGGEKAHLNPHGHLLMGAALPNRLVPGAESEKMTAAEQALARSQTDPAAIRRVGGVGHAMAHMLGINSFDYQRPVSRKGIAKEENNAVALKTPELAPHEMHALQREVSRRVGADTIPVPFDGGIYLVNRSKLSHPDFHQQVDEAAADVLNRYQPSIVGGAHGRRKERPDAFSSPLYVSGERVGGTSEDHKNRAIAALGPHLSRRLFAKLAAQLGPEYRDFAARHKLKLNLPAAYQEALAEEQPQRRRKGRRVVAALARSLGRPTPLRLSLCALDRQPNVVLAKSLISSTDVDQAEKELRTTPTNGAIDRDTAVKWGARFLAALRLKRPKQETWEFRHEALEHAALTDKQFYNQLHDELGTEDSVLPSAEDATGGKVKKSGRPLASWLSSSAPLIVLRRSLSEPASSAHEVVKRECENCGYIGDTEEFKQGKCPRCDKLRGSHEIVLYRSLFKRLTDTLRKSEITHVLHYHGPSERGVHQGVMFGMNANHEMVSKLGYTQRSTVHGTNPIMRVDTLSSSSPFAGADMMKHVAHHAAKHEASLEGFPAAVGGRSEVGKPYYHHLLRRYGGHEMATEVQPEAGVHDIDHVPAHVVKRLVGKQAVPHPVHDFHVNEKDLSFWSRLKPGSWKIHHDKPMVAEQIYKSARLVLRKSEITHVLHYQEPELPSDDPYHMKGHQGTMFGLNKNHEVVAKLDYFHNTKKEQGETTMHVTHLASSSPFAGADLMRHIVHHAAQHGAGLHGIPAAMGGRIEGAPYYHHLLKRYGGKEMAAEVKPERYNWQGHDTGGDIKHVPARVVQRLAAGKEAPHPVHHVKLRAGEIDNHLFDVEPGGLFKWKIHRHKPLEPEMMEKSKSARTREEEKRRAREPNVDPEDLTNQPWYNESVRSPRLVLRRASTTPGVKSSLQKGLHDRGRADLKPSAQFREVGASSELLHRLFDVPAVSSPAMVLRTDASTYKSSSDRSPRYAVLLAQCRQCPSARVQLDRLSDRPLARSHVDTLVLSSREDLEVPVVVIKPVLVPVVNDLGSLQRSTKLLLHDQPMLQPLASDTVNLDANQPVGRFISFEQPDVPVASHDHRFLVVKPECILGFDSGLHKAHKLHYKTDFAGLPISIENRAGSYRHWHDPHTGKDGKTLMRVPYGYIRRTEGADGDHVDCFLGDNENATHVYVVHQMKPPNFNMYDEDKVVLGASSPAQAKRIYLQHYSDPRFFGWMDVMPLGEFRAKVMQTKEQPGMVTDNGHPMVVLAV